MLEWIAEVGGNSVGRRWSRIGYLTDEKAGDASRWNSREETRVRPVDIRPDTLAQLEYSSSAPKWTSWIRV